MPRQTRSKFRRQIWGIRSWRLASSKIVRPGDRSAIWGLNNLQVLYVDSLQSEQLKRSVEEVAGRQPHFGERLPCRWFHCDQSLDQLTMSGLNFCSLAQVIVSHCSTVRFCSHAEERVKDCLHSFTCNSAEMHFNTLSVECIIGGHQWWVELGHSLTHCYA